MEKLRDLYLKYKELILYVFFGGLTTLVNLVVYYICTEISGIDIVISNVTAWLISVLFAYITNKLFVFESRGSTFPKLMVEIGSFFACRVFSGVLDTAIMFLFVERLAFPNMLIKVIANIVVIILNYIFSKVLIFRKKTN